MAKTYEERQQAVREHLEKERAAKMCQGGEVPKMFMGGVTPPMIPGAMPMNPAAITANPGATSAPASTPANDWWESIKNGLSDVGKDTRSSLSTAFGLSNSSSNPQPPNPPPTKDQDGGETGAPNTDAETVQSPPSPPPVAPPLPQDGVSKPAPNLKDLFNQDPSTLTKGFNPEDRQALAAQMNDRQKGFGNILSEALAGIGDAIAARGGVNQDALGNVFKLESQQRAEALDNFDKARQAAVQNFQNKTQMGENAIKQLAAKDAYGVADPNLAKQLGAPPGTLNKDLPIYLQVYSARAAQELKRADLIVAASKQASEENKAFNENPGATNIKQTPEQRQAWITNRTRQLVGQYTGQMPSAGGSQPNQKTINGQAFVKHNGQWYHQ